MSGQALMIAAIVSMALVLVALVGALVWLQLLRQEALADYAASYQDAQQLRLMNAQQDAEINELRAAVRAERAHVEQLTRQLHLLSI